MKQLLDPYAILGIASGASSREIQAVYENLIRRLTLSSQSGSPGANAQLKQVRDAYEMLTDRSGTHKLGSMTREFSDTHGFSIRVTPSKRTIENLSEPQVIYLLVEIVSDLNASRVATTREAGLNLTLVLDNSNSMKGVRLDRVKVAATEIIDQLTEKDYISVVGFNDWANVVIEATAVKDKKRLASRTRMIKASGGTEIHKGLLAGVKENRKFIDPQRINHIILLTDGNTYGDQEDCLSLARQVALEGIGISTLGLGSEWNDKFLDELASITGGSSGFIRSASSVVAFMNNQVQSLANIFAERLSLSIAADEKIDVEMLFKIKPSPQPLPYEDAIVQIGGMQFDRSIGLLVQMQIPPDMPLGFQSLARIVVSGDIISDQIHHVAISDVGIEVGDTITFEEPPGAILDALGKLTLYRMQEHANDAIERGNIEEATQQLQNLATRLLDFGETELAEETLTELSRLQKTNMLSDEGRKAIKYQTRYLISPDTDSETTIT